ncbi:MAG: mycofactocin system FadH/OYE family oxidoreductase 2, partial [Ktedonobacteraceae bacterium]
MMPDKLFQPLAIGPREVSNRIIFGSHTTNFARHNLLSEQHADYYEARAAGGAGIIVLEEHIVHSSDMPYEYALAGYLPGTPTAIARVAERIHAHGALAIAQLNHNGQQSVSDHSQREILAPSAIADVSTREVPKAMEPGDISAVIEGFALVTRHAVQGNADGIELQISDRSLLRQFLSPLTNQRGDQYGGSLDNRLRFPLEVFRAMREVWPARKPMSVRISATDWVEGGVGAEDSVLIARALREAGVDLVDVSAGQTSILAQPVYGRMFQTPFADRIRNEVGVPTMAVGNITEP